MPLFILFCTHGEQFFASPRQLQSIEAYHHHHHRLPLMKDLGYLKILCRKYCKLCTRNRYVRNQVMVTVKLMRRMEITITSSWILLLILSEPYRRPWEIRYARINIYINTYINLRIFLKYQHIYLHKYAHMYTDDSFLRPTAKAPLTVYEAHPAL
jgi:hypothetical protein